MKWIKLQPLTLDKELKFVPKGKPIYVNERNKFFDWYKNNPYFKVLHEFHK